MKKKLVQINTVCNGSIGQIMHDIQSAAEKEGYETISFVGRRKVYKDLKCEKFGNPLSFWVHVALNTIFDCQGYGSYFVTKKLVCRLREENPDIIHLHNLHGYYLYLPLLFQYLKNEFKGKIYWTFHDCWTFTGHCPHFTMVKCNKWKKACYACPQKKQYPISIGLDLSSVNYRHKKEMFTSLDNLVIITPSQWMRGLICESFFKKRTVEVVNNGIDLQMFKPCKNETEMEAIRRKYKILSNKKILLGVANIWEKRKGLGLFEQLAGQISNNYVIVLVGLTRKQIRVIPDNMIGIERTENKEELAMLYSMAHIFINPSVEESFSLVTVEAMACGAPVIALDTSAVKELINEENGIVLSKNETEEYLKAIQKIENANLLREKIAENACKYSKERMTEQVLRLYEK